MEILVAVSALAVMGVLLTQVFVTTIRTNTKNEISKEVKQNGDLAVSIMTRMILNARDVVSDCLSSGSTGSSITITNPDAGTTTFECKSDAGVLRIASTSAAPAYLTGTAVTITGADCANGFIITCTLLPSDRKSVGISFSLAQKGTPPDKIDQASETYATTITLRN